ncbi:hypothetical protein CSB37_03655 [bacterium DOLZORAL124_38_8]|nr:MAG: hypothetical protein CSB37_03655 [bacterium DOLZORAL124_38_8]
MIERTCRQSGEKFEITKTDLKFYAKMGVITAEQLEKLASLPVDESVSVREEKIPQELLVGLPTLCESERQRRRMCWRNERKLYQRKCDGTGKTMVSVYDDKTSFPVYSQDYWWSDNWDATDYGKDFDFSKPFFEQFQSLLQTVPQIALWNNESENSDYNNCCFFNKNCYLNFNTDHSEDSCYNYMLCDGVEVFDSVGVLKSELCYECLDCENGYELKYSQNCKNCSDSWFLQNCIGCSNCFGCVNLRNKEYYFLNEKCTPEEYEAKLDTLNLTKNSSLKNFRTSFVQFCLKFGQKYSIQEQSENCTGNYIRQSKDCVNSFDLLGKCDSVKNFDYGFNSNFVHEALAVGNAKYAYEVSSGDKISDSCFIQGIKDGPHMSYYSMNCVNNSQNCFGCVGLKKRQYCILNKQYTQEEYEALVSQIIEHMKKTGEWGEFFPAELSPFAYNETVAQEYFPLTKEEIVRRGYKWKEEKHNFQYTGPKYEMPDDIADVPDDIVNKVLECERSGKFYRIQPAELRFYRKMNLPIPRLHPDERHKDRVNLRNPRKLWQRTCADCGCKIQTTFAPNRPEKILCEACYLKVVD